MHVAYLPWQPSDFPVWPYYRVYIWRGGWTFTRPTHPDLETLDGSHVTTLEQAKQVCEEDFAVVARLHQSFAS